MVGDEIGERIGERKDVQSMKKYVKFNVNTLDGPFIGHFRPNW